MVKKRDRSKKNISAIFWLVNFLLLIFLTAFYVFQAKALARDDYLSSDYEKKSEIISKENKVLEVKFSKLNSLANIENYINGENFIEVSPNHVKYIRVLKRAVVTAK